MFESAACVMHLCDSIPPPGSHRPSVPAERALWYRWLTYLTNTVQATFMLTSIRGARPTPRRPRGHVGEGRDARGHARHLEDGSPRGPDLLGERFSSADIYLFMLTRWGRRLEKWWDRPKLGAHYRRVIERPAIKRVYEQEGLEERVALARPR